LSATGANIPNITASTSVLVGATNNPNARELLVSGSGEITTLHSNQCKNTANDRMLLIYNANENNSMGPGSMTLMTQSDRLDIDAYSTRFLSDVYLNNVNNAGVNRKISFSGLDAEKAYIKYSTTLSVSEMEIKNSAENGGIVIKTTGNQSLGSLAPIKLIAGESTFTFTESGKLNDLTLPTGTKTLATTDQILFTRIGASSSYELMPNSFHNNLILGLEHLTSPNPNGRKLLVYGDIEASDSTIYSTNIITYNVTIKNTGLQNQWNTLMTFGRALNVNVPAFSQKIFDNTAGVTSINKFWGLFSDISTGTDSGPVIEARDDGQLVFRSNMTVADPMPNNTALTPQLRFKPLVSGSTYLSKYMPYIYFGLAHSNKEDAFIRWTYSTGGLNYVGFNYGTATSSTDIMSLSSSGNMAVAGTFGSSDKRIKKDIVDADLDECITVMKSIKLKKYKYTDAYQETCNTTKENVWGFLADDILENEYLNYCGEISRMPKHLSNGEVLNDFKTIEKSKILTVLWGCCNSQQNKIEALESEIANIKSETNNLKTEMKALIAAFHQN
jgi:hypothetical protein